MNGKWFVNNYDRLMKPMEEKSFGHIRENLISKAVGEVLEIGCGTGVNFAFYRNVAVTAIEPSEVLRNVARERAVSAAVPIRVLEGDAERLPFADNSFDTAVGTLVFCTIPDAVKAIREVKRVCKPDGKILLFEHVRHDNPLLAGLQDVLTPIWKRMCDGCHLNRDTEALLRQEGVQIEDKITHLRTIFISIEARNAAKAVSACVWNIGKNR